MYAYGNSGLNYIDWMYLNGTQNQPRSGMSGASLTFTMPATSGVYYFVFYSDNSYTVLATSPYVFVGL